MNKKYGFLIIVILAVVGFMILNKVAVLISLITLIGGIFIASFFDKKFYEFSENLYVSLFIVTIMSVVTLFNPVPFIGEVFKGILAFTVVSIFEKYFKNQTENNVEKKAEEE